MRAGLADATGMDHKKRSQLVLGETVMAIISATKRIAVEMLKTLDDAIKQNLVLPLNSLNEQVVGAINGQLNFKDNMTSKIGSQTFTDGVMVVVSNPLGTLPAQGIIAINTGAPAGIKNIYVTPQGTSSQIGITVLFNAAGATSFVRYLVIGG